MNIQVCAGSACHIKGSYNIINELNGLITENHLEDVVKVQIAFCLGRCKDGVTIKIEDEIITGVSLDNVEQVFKSHVMGE